MVLAGKGGVAAGPIARNNYEAEIGIGVIYVF
jgi:hypothetical protein